MRGLDAARLRREETASTRPGVRTQVVTYSGGEVLVEAGEICDTVMVSNVCAVP